MEGFEEWAHARSAALARAAFLLTGDVHLAEDLAQETLVRVAMQWSRARGVESPDALARVVMYRIAVDGWRRRGSRPREVLGALPDRGATAPSVEDGLVLRDARAHRPRARPSSGPSTRARPGECCAATAPP